MTLDIASVRRPCRGEKACGDSFAISEDDGVTLIAMADGLGHGPLAEEASKAFCEYAEANSTKAITFIMEKATSVISRTRGAAAALIRVNEKAGTLTFCGIGNIEFQAVSKKPMRPVCSPGIVGRPLRKVVPFEYQISDGDTFAVYSDGISSRYELKTYATTTPQKCVDAILENHGKYHDDATCLVVRINL